MALFGEKKESGSDALSKALSVKNGKENEIKAQLSMAEMAQDPAANPALKLLGQWVLETKLEKDFPCEHRTYYEQNAKDRIIEVARPMHIFCDAEAGGQRDHIWSDCLNCRVAKYSHTDLKNVVQASLSTGAGDPHEVEDKVSEAIGDTAGNSKKKMGRIADKVKKAAKEEAELSMEDDEEYQRFLEWRRSQQK
jgi:hypothetical protein